MNHKVYLNYSISLFWERFCTRNGFVSFTSATVFKPPINSGDVITF